MATILFTWELGGGRGHLMQMAPLAQGLVHAGHTVVVALRHLTGGAAGVFGRIGVRFRQAPFKSRGALRYARTYSFAHLLANVGWDDKHDLFPLACAWRHLLESVSPDLVVFDHSPTALLAARALDLRRVTIGSGFCVPPDRSPLPSLRPESEGPGAQADQLAQDEARVSALANRMLAHWGVTPMDRLGRLYGDVDETLLTTFPELDHFPGRIGGRYWGPVNGPGGGKGVTWPEANGRRVYAYLKPFPALGDLLRRLNERGDSTVVFADGIDAATRRRHSSATLRFKDEPLDLAQAGRECDLAITNAGHGVTAAMLLAGKPLLLVPIHLEQRLLAAAAERNTGAAVTALAKGADVAAKLDEVLSDDRYAEAARRFAEKYAAFDPAAQVARMVGRVEELLATGTGRGDKGTAGHGEKARGAAVPAGVFRA